MQIQFIGGPFHNMKYEVAELQPEFEFAVEAQPLPNFWDMDCLSRPTAPPKPARYRRMYWTTRYKYVP